MFEHNEDQTLLSESVTKFTARHYTDEARMGMGETALNDTIWGEIAEQGWLMLPYTEDLGGLRQPGETGAGDMITLFEAMGPALMVEPVLASAILAGGLLSHSPDPSRFADEIAEIAAGSKRAAAALHEARARHDLSYCETRANRSGDTWTLMGAKTLALGGAGADLFVVLARIEGKPGEGTAGLGLFLVPSDAAGLTTKPYRLRDDHWAADIELFDTPAILVAGPTDAAQVLDGVRDKARLCLAAEAVGLSDRAVNMTLAYATERRQFGKAIGEFQVVQHYIVEMSNSLEQARSLVYAAAGLAELGWNEASHRAIARAYKAATKSGMAIAKKAAQLHGGMGMSEEMPLGRILRRQMAISLLFPADNQA